jgi:cysteine-rich repeat protein
MMKTLRVGFIVGAGLLWLCGSPAGATIVQFAATLNGAQETPPNGSAGSGSGTLTMDTDANTLIGSATFSGLGSAETMAHIHGFSAIGVPSGIIFNLAIGSPKAVNWNFAEGQQANIIAGLTYFNVHTTGFPGGEIRGQILRVPSCGDGILDGGETCDDGNVAGGDCCSAACLVEASGDPCASDGDPCTLDECDGAGNCGVGAPRTGCRTALKSALALKDTADNAKDKLIWKWLKGAATDQVDFGVPTGTTAHTLCLFAGPTDTALGSVDIPPGSGWAPISDKGYKFKDATGTPDGVTKTILKGGVAGKAKALVKGKGDNLPDLLGAALPLPVTAQLVNDANNICFEGLYDTADIKKNDGEQFKAKAQ